MKNHAFVLNAFRPRLKSRIPLRSQRHLLTLAIETSCDDTSVAVLEKEDLPSGPKATLHFHKKITSDNTAYHGVHPLAALYSHQENLADLVAEAVKQLPMKRIPDFISVTRGPGMRSNLFTGIDTAKGLAVAWQTDLVGVHHMQAHALTPRLVAALQDSYLNAVTPERDSFQYTLPKSGHPHPNFPFLSVLASGGHTLLIQSESLTSHTVLAGTIDIAVGECLDKVARAVLPSELLQSARTTMYGALLEDFAFSDTPIQDTKETRSTPGIAIRPGSPETRGDPGSRTQYKLEDNTAHEYRAIYRDRYAYAVPRNGEEARKQNMTKWGWTLNQPLTKASGGLKNKSMEMSFSGLMTAVERLIRFRTDPSAGKLTNINRSPEDISIEERKDLARETMRATFEHIASRVVLGLQQAEKSLTTVVMSGGVAANSYLRYILASTLCAHEFSHVRIVFPPPALCTDNAAMIAWAGLEMYEAGYKNSRNFRALRKWPLDKILSPSETD